MKFVPYFLYLWLIGFHIVVGRDVSSIYGVSINLTALVVVCAIMLWVRSRR